MRTAFGIAAAAMIALGGAAHADSVTHEVTIFDNDFMPPVVLADPGDKIVFYNTDEWTHRIDAIDATWTTGEISADGSVTINVNNGHTQEYQLDASYFPAEESEGGEEEDQTEGGLVYEENQQNADEGEVVFDESANG